MTDARQELAQILSGADGLLAGADDRAVKLALRVARIMKSRLDVYLIDAERGRRVLAAAQSGHRSTHGTPEQRRTLYAKYQATVNELHQSTPSLSWHQLTQRAANQCGCSYKTISRNTENPIKKRLDTAATVQKIPA